MNIFYLAHDQYECARYHVKDHCTKMILEYAQILSTTHRVAKSDPNLLSYLYKSTHVNHPSTVWARQSKENYFWLADMLWCLCDEFYYRRKKFHKTQMLRVDFKMWIPDLPDKPFTPPPAVMPEEYIIGDSIESYRNYYKVAKTHLHNWENREVPEWINN